MRDVLLSPILYRTVRIVLAALFLVAGAVKLQRPELFAVTVKAFGILPKSMVMPMAMVLPLIEILAALGLLLDLRGSLAVITGLLGLFIGVIVHALRMGLDIDCGCYGPGEPEAVAFSSLRTSLHRDLAMLAGVAFLYWWRHARACSLRRIQHIVNPLKKSEAPCAR